MSILYVWGIEEPTLAKIFYKSTVIPLGEKNQNHSVDPVDLDSTAIAQIAYLWMNHLSSLHLLLLETLHQVSHSINKTRSGFIIAECSRIYV